MLHFINAEKYGYVREELAKINSFSKQSCWLEKTLNKAINNEDHELADAAALAVIRRDNNCHNPNTPADFRLFCLKRLLYRHNELRPETYADEDEGGRWAEDIYNILWFYKSVISDMAESPDTSREEISEAVAHMRDVYAHYNAGETAVVACEIDIARTMGELDRARELYEKLQILEDGQYFSDCPACQIHNEVKLMCGLGRWRKALEVAEPLLAGKVEGCGEAPRSTYSSILHALAETYQYDRAREILPLAEQAADKYNLHMVPEILAAAIAIGDSEAEERLASLKMFEMLADQDNALVIMQFFIATAHYNEGNEAQARELAQAFDERNGNRYRQCELDKYLAKQLQQ